MIIERRRQIDSAYRVKAGIAAMNFLTQHPLFEKSQRIACYFATPDEFDCTPIINAINIHKKHCYLPVLTKEKSLQFASYLPGDALQPNQYQIPEPVNSSYFPAENLDLVIMPLVAFDEEGNRLGQGGGYYDKTFAFKLESKNDKPFLLGLGFEDQRVTLLSRNKWDVKCDGLLTEHGLIILNSRSFK